MTAITPFKPSVPSLVSLAGSANRFAASRLVLHRCVFLVYVFFAAAALLDVIAFIAGVTFITPHSVTEIAAVLIAALIASPRRASLLGIVAVALKN